MNQASMLRRDGLREAGARRSLPPEGALGWRQVREVRADDPDGLMEIGFFRGACLERSTGWASPGGFVLDPLDRAPYVRDLVWRGEGGRLVAAARLLLPQGPGDRVDLDFEASLPAGLPARRQWGEVSRVVIAPEHACPSSHRAATAATLRVLVASGRTHLVAVAERGAVGSWEAVGMERQGSGWLHQDIGARHHSLLTLDVLAALHRDTPVSRVVWDECFAPAAAVALPPSPSRPPRARPDRSIPPRDEPRRWSLWGR